MGNLDEKHNFGLFALGDKVKVSQGPNKGTKGVITDLDVANVRVTIQTKSGRKVNVSEVSCEARNENKVETKSAKRYKEHKMKISMPKKMSQNDFKTYETSNRSWLVAGIRIRVVDPAHSQYKSKFVLTSVLTPYLYFFKNPS